MYVGDVARAHLRAAALATIPAGRVDERAVNIGTGRETSVLELAHALMRASGRSATLSHADARPGEQRRSVVSIDKASRVLGWTPEVSLEDGLAKTFSWFSQR